MRQSKLNNLSTLYALLAKLGLCKCGGLLLSPDSERAQGF